MPNTLYHISDAPDIARFAPRPAPPDSGQVGDMVWAIDRAHLHNYLLPRDCPRVTFYALPESTAEDEGARLPSPRGRGVGGEGSRSLLTAIEKAGTLDGVRRMAHMGYPPHSTIALPLICK